MSPAYLIKRLMAAIPVLVIVSIMAFSFIHLIPGDPAIAMLGLNATPAQVEALRREMGLNKPVVVQYIHWLAKMATGDMGTSVLSGRSIFGSITERLPHTLALAFLSILLSISIAIPLGIVAAARQNRLTDRVVMLFALVGVSVPSFWVGILCIILFSVKLNWLPASGYVSVFEHFFEGLRYLILPAFSLAMVLAAVSARMMRSSMLEALRQDYIRTARAKGLDGRRVVWRHGLRNAGLPVVTVLGLQLGTLLGGAVITEAIFSWPGIGQLTIEAIQRRDYPLLQGCVLTISLAYVVVNTLTDLVYAALDPRVRLGDDG